MLRRGCKASERRRHLNDSLSWQQDQALSSSIYLLRQIGPIGFLLREEEPEKGDFRVTTSPPIFLGDLGDGEEGRGIEEAS
ncbi:zinc finger SWIM-type containing 2 [Cricetulus griseus]